MENLLKKHFDQLDLDIRKKPTGYSRFMDQKVTPDVLSFIADCIVNFMGGKDTVTSFTTKDIWGFPYFVKNTIAVFGKPSPVDKTAGSEYDKFIAQPLKSLAFSKILEEKKDGIKNTYTVLNPEVLEYISQSERNSWYFLVTYIVKVLTDSGFINKFEIFHKKDLAGTINVDDFETLKSEFQNFMRGYTEINGDTEINRIFPKILNPYAAFYQIRGTEKGHLTRGRFSYSDLMYNRENFRDIGKNKTLSRKDSFAIIKNQPEAVAYHKQKAKNIIKRHYTHSELNDTLGKGEATQVHHIFPENEFPEISDYLENLILLTPQQHNTRAHPKNNTHSIDREYQKECLLAKIESISSSILHGESLYSIEKLIHVLNIGFKLNLSTKTSLVKLKTIVLDQRA